AAEPGWQRMTAALRGLYASANEPLPADLLRRLEAEPKLDAEGARKLLHEAWVRLPRGRRPGLQEGAYRAEEALFGEGEPWAAWVEAEPFVVQPRGRPTGIGVEWRIDPATGAVEVLTPRKGGPAHLAGLRAGDRLLSITHLVDAEGKPLVVPLV